MACGVVIADQTGLLSSLCQTFLDSAVDLPTHLPPAMDTVPVQVFLLHFSYIVIITDFPGQGVFHQGADVVLQTSDLFGFHQNLPLQVLAERRDKTIVHDFL